MKTALLVIDYINGIINGSCRDYANKHGIVAKANQVIAAFRKTQQPIYFIRLAFDENYTGLPLHSKTFNYIKEQHLFMLGNKDTDFVAGLDIQEGDCIINKSAASPFYGNILKELFEKQGVEKLIFTGVATDNAINIGVREAHDMGYYTVVVKDTCGAQSQAFHDGALMLLEKIANELINTDDALKKI